MNFFVLKQFLGFLSTFWGTNQNAETPLILCSFLCCYIPLFLLALPSLTTVTFNGEWWERLLLMVWYDYVILLSIQLSKCRFFCVSLSLNFSVLDAIGIWHIISYMVSVNCDCFSSLCFCVCLKHFDNDLLNFGFWVVIFWWGSWLVHMFHNFRTKTCFVFCLTNIEFQIKTSVREKMLESWSVFFCLPDKL